LLGERLSFHTLGFAIGVICCVALGKRTAIKIDRINFGTREPSVTNVSFGLDSLKLRMIL
jgi:hypothetical protein